MFEETPNGVATASVHDASSGQASDIFGEQTFRVDTEGDSEYTSTELMQMAYDSVEGELDALRTELRLLKERHQAEESRLERRIKQKEALRRKIAEAAPA